MSQIVSEPDPRDVAGSSVTRRRFGAMAVGALASLTVGGTCHESDDEQDLSSGLRNDGRIEARPRAGVVPSVSGTRALGLGRDRDAIVQLPDAGSTTPLPLLVLLHGADGSAAGVLRRLGPMAHEAGVAVLAPDSRGSTWDAIRDDFGRDVDFIQRALQRVFDTVATDAARVSIGGFSDGATYAVSLGLINGDLFRRVLAFSPGFVITGATHGKPRFFISHGTADRILPIDRCSRVIVQRLQNRGYDVTFREFEGAHEVPASIAREGMKWAANL
jgi:phospholipase/carboxylesterase